MNPARLGKGFFDWDLVTCINELRRYIYGSITEKELSLSLNNEAPFKKVFCALSYYPTTDQGGEQMRELDGWLVNILRRALKQRYKLATVLLKKNKKTPQPKSLISGSWYKFSKVPQETAMPSFFKAWLYTRKTVLLYDLSKFPTPPYVYA